MGKASSAKKVARAARAGGTRRPGQRRQLGYPILVFLVCALGLTVVLYARNQRQANASPQAGLDHWHAAYTVAECGAFDPPLASVGQDGLGIHTHEDGLIHIEPQLDGAAGSNARLELFLSNVGVTLTDDTATFPDGSEWDEETAECDGEPAQIVVARWIDGQDAADGERPNEIVTEDFDAIRFRNDREAYTVALVPESGLDSIPVRPDIAAELNEATQPPTTEPSTSASSTTTTAGGAATTTTAPPPGGTEPPPSP